MENVKNEKPQKLTFLPPKQNKNLNLKIDDVIYFSLEARKATGAVTNTIPFTGAGGVVF